MNGLVVLLVLVVVTVGTVSVYLLSNTGVEEESVPLDYETRGRENPYPSLNFTIDCSRLENEFQDDCREFIHNQENLVYPELERITGIDLRWCYDTINYTIHPESFQSLGGLEMHGSFLGRRSTAEIQYMAQVSVDSRCKTDAHELVHAFDNCIGGMGGNTEVTAVALAEVVRKKLCPGEGGTYNLSRILGCIIPRIAFIEDPNIIDIRPYYDCLAAQASMIYYGDEEFFRKFYERLLQEPIRELKDGAIITEAIIYASDKIDENVTIHCLDDSGQPLMLDY
ncbi:MAG: hypothetical protein JSV63_00050 [Candidatus Aenigmatarchaeota archaeon]|nr:MAG: hypothetical protein JSV63_00050 [Candidatus Aenigmarchaeota archaeon]